MNRNCIRASPTKSKISKRRWRFSRLAVSLLQVCCWSPWKSRSKTKFCCIILASSVAFVQAAIEHIFPLVYEFRKPRPPKEPAAPAPTQEVFIVENAVIEDENDLISGPESDQDEDDDVDDIIEGPTSRKRAFKKTNKFAAKRCKRPPGKVESDPFDDLISVSDVEEEENVSWFF